VLRDDMPSLAARCRAFAAGSPRLWQLATGNGLKKTLTDFFSPWPRLQAAPGLIRSPARRLQAAYRGGCGAVEKN
jgi:hypothetical protein